jgi:hypothetical protein
MRLFAIAAFVAVVVAGCNSPALQMPPASPSEQDWIDTCGLGYVLCPGAIKTCCVQGYACCGGGFPELPCDGGPPACEAVLSSDEGSTELRPKSMPRRSPR